MLCRPFFLVASSARSLVRVAGHGRAMTRCLSDSKTDEKRYKVTFRKANNETIISEGKKGDSLLDVIVNNNLDFDGFGACEGTLTCSTCHVILSQKDYDAIPNKPLDEELDMLDLAFGLTDTSRLGCQLCLDENFNDIEVQVPATINDARLTPVDFYPKLKIDNSNCDKIIVFKISDNKKQMIWYKKNKK